jgi:hypothetical protein
MILASYSFCLLARRQSFLLGITQHEVRCRLPPVTLEEDLVAQHAPAILATVAREMTLIPLSCK